MSPAGVTISTPAEPQDSSAGLHEKNPIGVPGSLRRFKALLRGWLSLGDTGQQQGDCELVATCRVAVR